MYCVHTHPGLASGDRTFRAKRAVPAERDTVAAWNVVYQDFIYHSIRTLAWFLPEAARFSETSSENLLEVYSLLIMWRNFLVYTFSILIILCIRDACGLIVCTSICGILCTAFGIFSFRMWSRNIWCGLYSRVYLPKRCILQYSEWYLCV